MRRLKYALMEYLTMFFIGGLFYYLTEIIYRGYLHYTMFLAIYTCRLGKPANKVGMGVDKPNANSLHYYYGV